MFLGPYYKGESGKLAIQRILSLSSNTPWGIRMDKIDSDPNDVGLSAEKQEQYNDLYTLIMERARSVKKLQKAIWVKRDELQRINEEDLKRAGVNELWRTKMLFELKNTRQRRQNGR